MEEDNFSNLIKSISFFKKNLALILIGIYTVSFVNYYIYYNSFNISIFNYVGINDLLFFTLVYFFKIFLIFISIEFILFVFFTLIFGVYEKIVIFFIKKKGLLYINSTKSNKERILNVFSKKFDNAFRTFRISIIFLSIFFALPFFPYKLLIIPSFTVYLFYSIDRVAKEKMGNFYILFSIGLITFFLVLSTLFDSYDKRFEKDDFTISFFENSKFISTQKGKSNYNFLGETSNNIFIFDIKKKESKIYLKENLNDVSIKAYNDIDLIVEELKNCLREYNSKK